MLDIAMIKAAVPVAICEVVDRVIQVSYIISLFEMLTICLLLLYYSFY